MFALQYTKHTPTPIIDLQCGAPDWNSHKMGLAINEPDELCQCGRTKWNQEHEIWCSEAVEERRKERERKMALKHEYIIFDREAI